MGMPNPSKRREMRREMRRGSRKSRNAGR